MDSRTIGALALQPADNLQGGYFFYCLGTRKRLQHTYWTELPMPESVKDQVHSMAPHANANNGLQFTDSDSNDLDAVYPDDDADDDNDADYDPAADEELSYMSDEDSDYLLDGNPIISEKPAKSDDLTSARSEGAHDNNKVARKAGIHQSWADMVKSRPPNQANAGLQPLNKR
jgi:hypothetical protein